MNLETINQEAKKLRALADEMAVQSRKVEHFCELMSGPKKTRKKKGELTEAEAASLLMRRRKNICKS